MGTNNLVSIFIFCPATVLIYFHEGKQVRPTETRVSINLVDAYLGATLEVRCPFSVRRPNFPIRRYISLFVDILFTFPLLKRALPAHRPPPPLPPYPRLLRLAAALTRRAAHALFSAANTHHSLPCCALLPARLSPSS